MSRPIPPSEDFDDLFQGLDEVSESEKIPEKDSIKRNANQILNSLRKKDIIGRLAARQLYIILFCLLLFAQNFFIFWLIAKAFHYDQLKELSLVLGTIITGTFIETVVIIKIIVQWVFSDIDYKDEKKDP
jgi:hypothetical protein